MCNEAGRRYADEPWQLPPSAFNETLYCNRSLAIYMTSRLINDNCRLLSHLERLAESILMMVHTSAPYVAVKSDVCLSTAAAAGSCSSLVTCTLLSS